MMKILLPVIAILIIAGSMLFLNKPQLPVVKNTGTIPLQEPSNLPVSLNWEVDSTDATVNSNGEIPLYITSNKNIFIDAVDLYVKYNPDIVEVIDVTSNEFVKPTVSKISPQNSLVVMNFLVSGTTGFKLLKDTKVEVARLKVKYISEGMAEFDLDDKTLVVENASAKVLPFNSSKLVINVSR